MASERVLFCGVSTRAAAESAARTGYAVEAIDSFGDLDQHPAVHARSLPRDLGRAFTAMAAAGAARELDCDAVVYLSPFENYPRAVEALARDRALWGNPPDVLRRVRNPVLLATTLRARGLPSLAVRLNRDNGPNGPNDLNDSNDPNDSNDSNAPNASMLKPLRSGGGHRIRPWRRGEPIPRGAYLQERASGTPGSLVFAAAGGRVTPIALSRQLIGDQAFGARGHRYCGNVVGAAADLQFDRGALVDTLVRMATVLVEEIGLTGLNGIDFMARDDVPFILEVNPRWTGAMELVERWTGTSLFAAHAAAFLARGSSYVPPWPTGSGTAGKAIVFARTDVVMGDTRRWLADESVRDVPHPGERIAAGHPVCTVFASGPDAADCYGALVRRARAVYEELDTRNSS